VIALDRREGAALSGHGVGRLGARDCRRVRLPDGVDSNGGGVTGSGVSPRPPRASGFAARGDAAPARSAGERPVVDGSASPPRPVRSSSSDSGGDGGGVRYQGSICWL
jgi:hypothetical protein